MASHLPPRSHPSTGQKGIGFKSIFKVTDCPEIHSNGFHLRFDKTCGPMGYILPHWADDQRPLDTKLEELNQHRYRNSRHLSTALDILFL